MPDAPYLQEQPKMFRLKDGTMLTEEQMNKLLKDKKKYDKLENKIDGKSRSVSRRQKERKQQELDSYGNLPQESQSKRD
jgi:adenylosuccinate lyase